MKTTITAVLLYMSISGFSQKIDGIGPFRLGKTLINEVRVYCDTMHQSVQWDTIPTTGKTMKAQYLDIAAVTLRDVNFEFYKDTLWYIEIGTFPDFVDIFEAKYGVPKHSITTKTVGCRTGLKINYTEQETYSIWFYDNVANGLEVRRWSNITYDDNCQPKYSSGFYMLVKRIRALYRKEGSKWYKDYLKSQSDSLRNQAKGL